MNSDPQLVHTKAPLEFTTPSRRIISWIPIVLMGIGIVGLIPLVWHKYMGSNNPNKQVQTNEWSDTGEKVQGVMVKKIKIDASGALVKPGIYEIPDDYRIHDVLITAGGLSANADREYVSKYINLSQKVNDGQKIYIPKLGENVNQFVNAAGNVVLNTKISINSVSQAELESLTGIGPATAGKIIDGRSYQSVDELIKRKIIPTTLFIKIKDKLSL